MFKQVLIAAACVVALLCAGCSAPMPDASAAVQAPDDAYFVLGVQPHNMMLQIDQAEIRDGQLVRFFDVLPLHEYGQAEGDFIVVKVKGGSTLALHSASMMAGHTIFGLYFRPTINTWAFQVPAGKVVYIGSVAFVSDAARGLKPVFSDDLDGARDYVAMHYPALAGKVEQGGYQMVRCRFGCH